jgi:Flp pilus assembly protein TadD
MRLAVAAVLGIAALGCASLEGARLYESGTRALEAGDSARAIAELERAAELVPHASEIQNHLGIAYLQSGRPDAAREAFERAVALDCSNAAAHDNLARLQGQAAR